MTIKDEEKREQKPEITTIGTSDEPHPQWKNHFHKNPIYFRIVEYFEAANEIDISNIGNKDN